MEESMAVDGLNALVRAQEWDEAEALCRSRVEAGVDVAAWKLQLGQVLLLADLFGDVVRMSECIEALTAAVEAAPDVADAHFWLGFALFVTGAEPTSDPRGR